MRSLIQAYQSHIQRIIKRMTGTVNEDLEQTVYIKLWQNKGIYREQGQLKAWIKTLTIHTCLDYFKSGGYRYTKRTQSDDMLEHTPSDTLGPEQTRHQLERQKIILRAIDDLPKPLKKTIILYEFEEYSYEQIALQTHVPIGTVRSRLSTARKILAEKLYFLKGDIS